MLSQLMHAYIMANSRPTLYTGVTNDLVKRVWQHKEGLADGFTKKYHLKKLVYFETIEGQIQAIIREKQIKNMTRQEKINMVTKFNPSWRDLYPTLLDSGQAGMTIGGKNV